MPGENHVMTVYHADIQQLKSECSNIDRTDPAIGTGAQIDGRNISSNSNFAFDNQHSEAIDSDPGFEEEHIMPESPDTGKNSLLHTHI